MNQFILLAATLLLLSGQAWADVRIKIHNEVRADSSAEVPMNLHMSSDITIWVDPVNRCATIDKGDGSQEIYVNQELWCTKYPDFETYKIGAPPNPMEQLATDTLEMAAGLSLLRPKPTFSQTKTGLEREINGFCCSQYLIEIVIPGSDTMHAEAWSTDEISLDPTLYGQDTSISETSLANDLEGFPMLIITKMGPALAIVEVQEFVEAEPPSDMYSLPAHYELLPSGK